MNNNINEVKNKDLIKDDNGAKESFFVYFYKKDKDVLFFSLIVLILVTILLLLIHNPHPKGFDSFGESLLMFPLIIIGIVVLISFFIKLIKSIISYLILKKKNKIYIAHNNSLLNNIKIKKKILIGIFAVLIIIISFVFISNKINKLSFIFKIKGDFTSSGAQRNYDASLTFINNVLVEGTESYYVGQGGGCTDNCERINSCKIINGEWVDVSGGSNCKIDYPFVPSTTKKGIEKQIKSKELKPMNECGHSDLCYEVLDLSHINDGKPGYSGGSMGNQIN